jgi:hypothetical protein
MIVAPKAEWPVVAAEPATMGSLFTGYIMPLAAIGPICGLIGGTVFFHQSLVAGLISAVALWVATLIGCYLTALVAQLLAPSFGGVGDGVAGLKLAGYSSTPGWIFAILRLYPPLGFIASIAGLYNLYVLWLGVPETMRVPKEKAIVYILILIVVEIAIYFAISIVLGIIAVAALAMTGGLSVR